jgi:putative ABC transport system permease protein
MLGRRRGGLEHEMIGVGLARDLRQAWRGLRGSPGFTAAAVATLAIGVGGTAAIFAIANGVLFRDLPFARADRLVSIATVKRDPPGRPPTVSLEELDDWRHDTKTFASLAGWRDWGMVRHVDGRTEPAYSVIVTPDLFQVLPVQPVIGRLFRADEDRPGANRVILLTNEYWRERFGSDPRVLGRLLRLERGPAADYEVIGVLPPAFTATPSFEDVKVVALSSIDPDAGTGRDRRNRQVFGRLRDGATIGEARAELSTLAAGLAQTYPATNTGWTVSVQPLIDREVGPIGDALRSFFAAVGFVFLIACANIASLQLARALTRRREFSIRQAIGDSRVGLVRSLLVESVLVALAAGVAGLLVAAWLVKAVVAAGPALPRAAGIRFDAPVFGFSLLISAAAGLLLGLPATLLATRVDLSRALKEEAGQVANAPAARARMLFVAAQVALTLMLLGGAVVATATLVTQLTRRPGFEPAGLATIFIAPPQQKYVTGEQVAALYTRIVEEARGVSGVEAASAVSATPLSGEGAEPVEFTVLDSGATAGPTLTADYFNAADGHFTTLQTPLLRGRDFLPTDTRASDAVAIVNETFQRRYLAGLEPIGARVRLARSGDVIVVVGVAGDVLRDLQDGAATPEIYWPYSQRPRWATTLLIRAANPGAAAAAVIERVHRVDGDVRVGSPRLMTDRVARSTRGTRFMVLMFGLFAGVALLLSVIGVYGLVSYSFAQRTREIGIRVSLGASPRRILALVASTGFAAVVAGSAIGALGLFVLARPLAAVLPQLGPLRPLYVGAAWLLLVAVGCAACYLPARRAASLDPARAMRI